MTTSPAVGLATGRPPRPGSAMGHEEAAADFEVFYSATYPTLRRLALARTGSWAAAEDLAQDAMADAHRRWAVIGRYENPAAWARRAVLNRSISRLRRGERERRAVERLAGRATTSTADDGPVFADDELWAAIRSLSPQQMQVVLLLWFEELSVAEVAATLDCGAETVRTHWRRARARLAAVLDEADRDDAGGGAGPGGGPDPGGSPALPDEEDLR